MNRVNSVFLSSILHKKVYDEFDESIGKLWDIYVTTEEGYPRAIGYKVKKDGEILNYEFRNIVFLDDDNGKILIKVRGVKDIIPRTFSYLLSKNLLDKQIVDVNGKKVVRVNDLKMAEIAVVAVDSGAIALGRRLGVEGPVKSFFKAFKRNPADSMIMWDNVESLEMVNDNLKISVPYKKLSKLKPADLADILEDMDSENRTKIFQSLDENLAADTLEEIEPEIQADLLANLSEEKASVVLEAMPNDEIADILDEVDEETAEKFLASMEKDDADEVRELMGYEEETVGSIMNRDYISFNFNITVTETIELLRELKPDDEVMYYIYITDETGKLQGVVSLRDIIISDGNSMLKDIMDKEPVKVKIEDAIDDVIDLSMKYDLLSLPVIDEEEILSGIVIIHDIIDEYVINSKKKKFKKVV
ncbi:CBS domain-containing protein [Clostridium sp. 19966]|uniref:magnesium transporter n=1 Tax=Clostridium sp. 19966 TaxID=2768166 RepID=UPI0028DF72B5|nr:CBS domain-containing protein [Clostridium sp. 19966]MDT8718516.1 CBS domain-containing protein [Clostridium sp. 19966]